MGIELPPELADVAARAGVVWPEADEDAMATQAQAWRDTATSMSTLAKDADTVARSALSSVTGDTGDAASAEWKTFVDADAGHLTSVVRDANAAADRLEHAADQVGTAKVEIVRNLVSLAQNTDAANAAAAAGHPTALAGLDTAVRGTAANVAHIESQLVSAVQPGSGVDMAAVHNPVNANPGHHLLTGVTTAATDVVTHTVDQTAAPVTAVTDTVTDTVRNTGATHLPAAAAHAASDVVRPGLVPAVVDTVNAVPDTVLPGHTGDVLPGHVGDVVPRHPGDVLPGGTALPAVVDTVNAVPGTVLPGHTGDVLPGHVADVVPRHPGDALPGTVPPGNLGDVVPAHPGDVVPRPGDVLPGHPGDVPPGAADVTGPVPSHLIDDVPTPPTGTTVQSGFAGGLEPAAAPQPNLPPAAPVQPLQASPQPAYGGGAPGGAPFPGTPAPPVGAPAPMAPPAAPPPARPTAFAPPAPVAPAAIPADRPADPAPRAAKPMVGPPGAPPPAKGERDNVLAAFWIHMFPIGHLPVASNRPARQLPPPPPELDYAAGLRFEPADHPGFDQVDGRPRLAELHEAIAHRAAAKAAAAAAPLPPPTPLPPMTPPGTQVHVPPPAPEPATVPKFRPVTPSAGITADHPAVQSLLADHDPLGDMNERDWDRRYLVRLGSVTPQGISPEGLEYNWPTSEQYPEGGSAPGEAETLPEDTVIDRFGSPHGRVFAADGTRFAQRSLPAPHKDTGYRRYRVTRPLPVWRAVSAAWFGQPGGGVRYRTTHTAVELVALGYLEEIA